MKFTVAITAALTLAAAMGCARAQVPSNANESRPPNAPDQKPAFSGQTRAPVDDKHVAFTIAPWANGLDHPWGLVFLPDGRGLVTERPGRIRYVAKDGKLSAPISGLPQIQTGGTQAGLFDVELDPAFASNRRVYFAYMAPQPGGSALTVMRAELKGQALDKQTVIFTAQPVMPPGNNMGGRMVFGKDGYLYLTVGDRFPRDYTQNQARKLDSDLGKIVRIDTDGNPAKGNPYLGQSGARPELYAIGTRSQEAIAFNPATGDLWEVEHGARGGDEINIIKPGKDYGWPSAAYGIDYSGRPILEGKTEAPGTVQPIYYWDPVIAPSGMMFYTGDRFPAWKGSLFIGGLGARALVRVTIKGDRVVGEDRLLKDQRQRIRDVRQGPDGLIYVLTDASDGQILRLSPGG